MSNLEVFTSSSCTKCTMLKEYLRGRGLPFVERNIGVQENMTALIDLGIKALPAVRLDDKVVVGFDIAQIEALLEDTK